MNDHHYRITTSREYIRAELPRWCSQYYIPMETVVEFYKEHWESWSEDPPDWFDDKFRENIPDYLLKSLDVV